MGLFSAVRRVMPHADKLLLRQLVQVDALNDRHSRGRAFEEHLCGTRQVLGAWNQPVFMQMAGLCHSLYSTDQYARKTLPLSDRARLRQFVGSQAEELVYLFCAVKRGSFFRTFSRAAASGVAEPITVEGREELGPPVHRISLKQASHLVILHLANLTEQACGQNGAPSAWLERFAALSKGVPKGMPDVLPEVFSTLSCVTRYAEREALDRYFTAARQVGDPNLAIASMEACLKLLPCLAEPDLWLSYLWGKAGEKTKQTSFAKSGLRKMKMWGAPWDKRLSYNDWMEIATLKAVTTSKLEALTATSIEVDHPKPDGIRSGKTDTAAPVEKESRLESYLLNYATATNRRSAAYFPGLRADEFWDTSQFQLATNLRFNNAAIRMEIKALDDTLFHDEAERIYRTGAWKVYMLMEAGRWEEEHCAKLPSLAAILKNSSEIRRGGGLIYLSRLGPGTEVAAHTGPTNMRLRLHFGLRIPEGDCGLRVATVNRKWQEGEALVFNDFHEHEVWNRTSEERLILLADIWHPDLSLRERTMLEAIHRMATENAKGLHRYWTQNEIAKSRRADILCEAEVSVDDLVL